MSEWSQIDELEGKLIDSWWASKEDKELFEEMRIKAEAFDEIFKLYIGYEDGWISFPRGHKSFNKAVIDVCKQYESGDSDG